MPAFTAHEIRQACDGRLVAGSDDAEARGISTDTRTLREGEAFLALKGDNHDAHDFIPQAIRAGAGVLVVEAGRAPRDVPAGVAIVVVDDTTEALMNLARWHRGRLKGLVLGVTGSCGKSTVKNMLGTILAQTGQCSVAQKSYNNRIGVSLSILQTRVDEDFVVLEMGTNHPGEIDELAGMARPHAGLITCIGECHLEGLGDRQGVREAKAELIPHIRPNGLLVLNADDDYCASLRDRYDGEVRTFGLHSDADVRPLLSRQNGAKRKFRLENKDFQLTVPGSHNVLNAAAAICMAQWAGATLDEARVGLTEVELPELRFDRRRIDGTTFILDCYNSNPTAMQASLSAFLQEPVDRRRMVVCGDMLELGEAAPQLHRRVGMTMALTRVDTLVAVGELGKHVVEGWQEVASPHQRALHVPSAEKAWLFVWRLTGPGDAVLVKGSRAMELEKIVEAIAERQQETAHGEAA